jgi:two-component system phosphate regulon response regulator OmpR
MEKTVVLAVDDDPKITRLVKQFLEEDGYRVLTAGSGKEAFDILHETRVNLILLDLVLPDIDGFALMTRIRSLTESPIIVVSGKGDAADKIVGLEMGADDYISKPFHLRELTARIKTVLRRTQKTEAGPAAAPAAANGARIIEFDGWTMNVGRFELLDPSGRPVDLTTGEFQLLQTLVEANQRALSREQLFDITRSDDYDSFDRAIDIQIGRLRKKLDDDPKRPHFIKTVRGVGYMFIGNVRKAS